MISPKLLQLKTKCCQLCLHPSLAKAIAFQHEVGIGCTNIHLKKTNQRNKVFIIQVALQLLGTFHCHCLSLRRRGNMWTHLCSGFSTICIREVQ